MPVDFQVACAAKMDPVLLYSVLRLRNDVFIVEQGAAYDDLDGRDIEPGARLFWAEDGGSILATLRVLAEPDGRRIGRVATAAEARGQGLVAQLMRRAVGEYGGERIALDAQQQLERWYQKFGFSAVAKSSLRTGFPTSPCDELPG
ncbi:GNAT family N-acetyltransferase [Arthrobacter sp. TMN-49]